jgi:hypothetical protein
MSENVRKLKCKGCRWTGLQNEALHAINPFADDNETMIGCPQCREPNSMMTLCDEPECPKEGTCGTPTLKGYRRTCFEHRPGAGK